MLSVDPTSPFTQGALLGDRIRLAEHYLDPGVYIRSMGTRGTLGGVAEATLQAGLVIDAAGRDVVIYETVGVGQSEIAIAALAEVVALVLMPGSGDSIQALKAGVMEIPDLVVLNKSELPGAKAARAELAQVLRLAEPARAPGARRDERARRHAGSRSCGARSSRAGRRSSSPARSSSAAARASSGRCSGWPLRALRVGSSRSSPGRDDLRALLDRVTARELDPAACGGRGARPRLRHPRVA